VAIPSIAGNARTDWGMLGNDQWGDCTIAGSDHVIMADCAVSSESYTAPSLTAVEHEYFGLTGTSWILCGRLRDDQGGLGRRSRGARHVGAVL
jgi:hypothetical protein